MPWAGHHSPSEEQRMFDSSDLIHSYTRAQAIEDGVLVDVSDVATEAGFKLPVAITRAAWARYVEVPAELELHGQSVDDRSGLTRSTHRLVTLKALCGPGDNMEPVVTIMLPNED
jgi:hypothetical protein